jgi:predicted DCC family thiol-disulfide oxidoreductase YuxK
MNNDTLYYDAKCPVCRAEANKLSRFTRQHLVLQNIHDLDEAEGARDKQTLLSRLHLKTAEGEWLTGLDANIRAWHHTPFRYLWQILHWPLVRPISDWCYERWLDYRNNRLAHLRQPASGNQPS